MSSQDVHTLHDNCTFGNTDEQDTSFSSSAIPSPKGTHMNDQYEVPEMENEYETIDEVYASLEIPVYLDIIADETSTNENSDYDNVDTSL